MDSLLRRRRLLLYFGLGAVGAGGIAALPGLRQDTATTPQDITNAASVPALPMRQPLPEFQGISQWLNSSPLSVVDLKGSVVLIQFWTFGCINCQRTLPYIARWHQQYAAQGLRVIGVHTPEFPHEREVNNIKSALQQHQITYPVPIDNQLETWKAYENRFWPRQYLADRNGILRFDHIGEGAYEETEQAIRVLLG